MSLADEYRQMFALMRRAAPYVILMVALIPTIVFEVKEFTWDYFASLGGSPDQLAFDYEFAYQSQIAVCGSLLIVVASAMIIVAAMD